MAKTSISTSTLFANNAVAAAKKLYAGRAKKMRTLTDLATMTSDFFWLHKPLGKMRQTEAVKRAIKTIKSLRTKARNEGMRKHDIKP